MSYKERYKKRKHLREKLNNSITVTENVDEAIVKQFLNSEIDKQLIKKNEEIIKGHYDLSIDVDVSKEEAIEFLDQFKKNFNQARFDQLVSDCKKEVINSIITPFGLGKIVAAYDKAGGNVDTVHNVREGVYATLEEQEAYENRGKYNSDDYHKDPNFIAINREYSQERKQGDATDYMSGEKLDPHKSHDLDHVKSAKEIHDDAGRVLAEKQGNELANTDSNLKPTTATNNRSKKADSMEDFLNRKNERCQKIDELKNKDNLSVSEQKELKKLEELSKIDDDKAMKADNEARKEIDDKINKAYYTSKKFAKSAVKTGAKEGAKMGMQQAIGLVLTEFFTAVFDEINDIYKNGYTSGFEDDRFFNVLKERLARIASRLKAKWKDAALAFKDGFLSGFISNLVTTVINAFVTTGKRVVRIIREGIFSLFRAVKLLLFPPEGMTVEEAMHEAKKIIASGLIISLGVIIEQYVDSLIKTTAVLEPFSDILTTVFVGSVTGIAVTMIVYYIDKKKNDKDAIKEMISQTDKKLDSLFEFLQELTLIRVEDNTQTAQILQIGEYHKYIEHK